PAREERIRGRRRRSGRGRLRESRGTSAHMIQAAIISTGDELTTGRTTDTNAGFIADKLLGLGIDVVAVLTVGDHHDRLRWAWREALRLAEVVIATGGLGPTADDLTTETVAELLGRPLREDAEIAERIRELFRLFNRPMPENNLKQARFPDAPIARPNTRGSPTGARVE